MASQRRLYCAILPGPSMPIEPIGPPVRSGMFMRQVAHDLAAGDGRDRQIVGAQPQRGNAEQEAEDHGREQRRRAPPATAAPS